MVTPVRKRTGRTGNRLLDNLPAADLRALADALEAFPLSGHELLYRVDDPVEHLYFPAGAVLALTMPPASADLPGIEIATVGSEGMTGFTALLGVPTSFTQAVCQVPGTCLRLPVAVLAEAMTHSPRLDRLVRKYVAVAYRTEIQGVVCNALHPVEQRLCRWLLVMDEKAAGEFPVTQDFLAARLGVKRPTVSLAAGALQKQGLIRYHRGTVHVLNRAGLEQCACDCFQITRAVYERVLES
jgi:CRP-like cAMP-binding protein